MQSSYIWLTKSEYFPLLSLTHIELFQAVHGKCNIFVLNRDNGADRVIPNTYDRRGGRFTSGTAFQLDSQTYRCTTQGSSPGIFDLAVRLTNLTAMESVYIF